MTVAVDPHSFTSQSWLSRDISNVNPTLSEQKTLESVALDKVRELSEAFANLELPKENLSFLLQEKRFYEKVKILSQPSTGEIALKSKICSFNHVNNYIIDRGILWVKPRIYPEEHWKPIYFEGEAQDIVPEEVRVDGANLVARAKDKIYYKKILEESNQLQNYTYKDVSLENNWIPQWFTLPVLSLLQNPFADNHLTLPTNYRAWDISHRGEYCGRIEDGLGNDHLNPLTVTSLYVLLEDGKTIEIFDPYVNIGAHVTISVFETAKSSFEAISLTSSASTLFLIGHETTSLNSGGVKKTLKAMTWLVDNDTLGYDPAIDYGLGSIVPRPGAFMLPMPGWMEHPFEFKGQAAVTQQITIFQTGGGNNARELRVAGWNEKGESGYYRKIISDKTWQFVNYSHFFPKSEAIESLKIDPSGSLKTSISNYEKGVLNCPKLSPEMKVNVILLNFGLASLTSTLRIEKEGKTVDLLLFKTKGILNFIFSDRSPVYQLALPLKEEIEPVFNELLPLIFGINSVLDLTVDEDHEKISLQPGILTGASFEFIFYKT